MGPPLSGPPRGRSWCGARLRSGSSHPSFTKASRCPVGAGTLTVRLHGNAEDTARKLNRTENLRPIPPGDPDFERIFGLRADAESINRGLEDTLYLRRAHSHGRTRQHVNLIGWALMNNSLTLTEHQARAPDQLAA